MMNSQIRSESYKLVTTRTNLGVAAGMVVLIALAVLLHTFGLPIDRLSNLAGQRGVLIDVGIRLGTLFAALLGALAITSEFRTGTIRPTLLVTPRRGTVVAAKTVCVLGAGAITGLLAAGTAAGVGSIGLAARGVAIAFTAGDIGRLLFGATIAGALWAVIGLGVGAVVRAQVPAIVGLFAWVLFVENILGDVPSWQRFAPGSLAEALGGQVRDGILTSAALAAVLLIVYSAGAALAGLAATTRRDVA
jgi:ABC-type transport system involved in multi-copper enzyme maturation permease subunit